MEDETDEQEIDIITLDTGKICNGTFVLAQFKGGKRKTSWYKYVCIVDYVIIMAINSKCKSAQRWMKPK